MATQKLGLGLTSPVADGGTAHSIDTDAAYTSGTLLTVGNNGTEKLNVAFDGAMSPGPVQDYGGHGFNVHSKRLATPAVGDGTANDRAALAAADALGPAEGSPGKTYKVDTDLTLSNGWRPNKSVLKPANGVTVTVSGPVEAGLYQWIDESLGGSVVFSAEGVPDRIPPQWWGALRDDDGVAGHGTDLGPALQKAMASVPVATGGTVWVPSGPYALRTAAEIPHGLASTANFRLIIDGVIRVEGAIAAISRVPADQTEAGTMVSTSIHIEGGGCIKGDKTVGQIGIKLCATYGSSVRGLHLSALDTGFLGRFSLACEVSNCRAENCKTDGFVAAIGDWTGATNGNSASNHTVFRGCRNYALAAMHAGFYVFGCSGCVVEDCITEGANPQYNVVFDANSSTTVKYFAVRNLHSENTPTGAIILAAAGGGVVDIDGVYFQTAAILVDSTGANADTIIRVRDVPIIPATSTCKHGNGVWEFENIGAYAQTDVTAAGFWTGAAPSYLYARGRMSPSLHPNVRASYFQFTAGTVSALDGFRPGGDQRLHHFYYADKAWDPGTVTNGTIASTTLTLTSAATGDFCLAMANIVVTAGVWFEPPQITSANTMTVRVHNDSGGDWTPGSFTLKGIAMRATA